MLYTAKLRLTSAMLGDQQTAEGIRRFNREAAFAEQLQTNEELWSWALGEAAEALNLYEVDMDTIRTAPRYKSPKMVLYTRRWKKNGKSYTEMFEAIKAGTDIYIDFMLLRKAPPGTKELGRRAPTAEELKGMLSVIGMMLGISPWGSKFGYGRFKVVGLEESKPALEDVE